MSKRSYSDMEISDNFKKKFKYYKSNKPKPSLAEVLSVDKAINITPECVADDPRAKLLGLNSLMSWKLYSFHTHPGLLFIKNPFTSIGQRYWIRRCLEDYPVKPNKMNIDVEMDIHNWWRECHRSQSLDKILQKKLRWTTLGYHHDWDSKVYTEKNRCAFPEELAELSDVVAEYLGYVGFKAEAAIVNYYHMDSTLSAHTDHSEPNLQAPLLSFSFGQSAVFLIGGKEKSTDPSALLIESGDIVVMSEQARLCYHAVPRILKANRCTWNECQRIELDSFDIKNDTFKYILDCKKFLSTMNSILDEDWKDFNLYVEGSRINMNVRQVLNYNQDSL